MRYIALEKIHTQAVKIGRLSKNNMRKTANRLAYCNVDKQIKGIVESLTNKAWLLTDDEIIEACGQKLWVEFLMAEIKLQGEHIDKI